ncbi:hypothetical protein M5E87_09735 [Flavonifractor plautii]|nr:hypothetical protein M5E87_09735 [Flavonifractor plautii]
MLVQCLVLVLSRIIMLPGNAYGAEGASTCSWAPCSVSIWRWGWCCGALPPFWRFCCWAGPGRCSALRSARRPDTGHRRRTSWMENIPASS